MINSCFTCSLRKSFAFALLFWVCVLPGLAQYGGEITAITNSNSLLLGQPLNLSVIVLNGTLFDWDPGMDIEFSWVTVVLNASWNSSYELGYGSDRTVLANRTANMSFSIPANALPTSPGEYSFEVHAAWNYWDLMMVDMDNSPQTVHFTVGSANYAPVIAAIPDKVAFETNLLSFTVSATDSDVPAQNLSYSLGSGAPSGAIISSSGLFTWTPPAGYAPRTNQVTVIVTDSGSPPMGATNSFNLIVQQALRLHPPTLPTNNLMVLGWESYPAKTYRVRYRDNVASGSWTNIDVLATGPVTTVTNALGTTRNRFYQLILMD